MTAPTITTHKGERISYEGLGSSYIAQAERRGATPGAEPGRCRTPEGDEPRPAAHAGEPLDDAFAKADLARGTRGT